MNAEHARIVHDGAGAIARWRKDNPRERLDLRDANLRDANLRGANLRGANLIGADLRYANLSYANLSDANLSDANLSGADLSAADLSGADLRGADLRGADLRGALVGGPRFAAPANWPKPDPALLRRIAETVLADPHKRLNMVTWHSCETTHCLAGWAVHLSGPAGCALEAVTSPSVAGAMLCPELAHLFYVSDKEAVAALREVVA